jgi:phosphoesterase RecJ-like protein
VDPKRRIRTYQPRRHARIVERAEVVFVLDVCGGWSRVGRVGEVLAHGNAKTIRIDHHPDPVRFTDLEVVDNDAAATAELIYDMVSGAGGLISEAMARELYVAILTDSGSFRYPKTSPRTHRIAADLIQLGANPAELYKIVYNQYTLRRLRLQGHTMDAMQIGADGRMAWSVLDQNTLRAYRVKVADLDNFAGLGMQIAGVQVCVLCVELPKGQVRVSVRSDGVVPVNDLAGEWGGGGHASASGATVKGGLDEVVALVLSRVEALIENSRPASAT